MPLPVARRPISLPALPNHHGGIRPSARPAISMGLPRLVGSAGSKHGGFAAYIQSAPNETQLLALPPSQSQQQFQQQQHLSQPFQTSSQPCVSLSQQPTQTPSQSILWPSNDGCSQDPHLLSQWQVLPLVPSQHQQSQHQHQQQHQPQLIQPPIERFFPLAAAQPSLASLASMLQVPDSNRPSALPPAQSQSSQVAAHWPSVAAAAAAPALNESSLGANSLAFIRGVQPVPAKMATPAMTMPPSSELSAQQLAYYKSLVAATAATVSVKPAAATLVAHAGPAGATQTLSSAFSVPAPGSHSTAFARASKSSSSSGIVELDDHSSSSASNAKRSAAPSKSRTAAQENRPRSASAQATTAPAVAAAVGPLPLAPSVQPAAANSDHNAVLAVALRQAFGADILALQGYINTWHDSHAGGSTAGTDEVASRSAPASHVAPAARDGSAVTPASPVSSVSSYSSTSSEESSSSYSSSHDSETTATHARPALKQIKSVVPAKSIAKSGPAEVTRRAGRPGRKPKLAASASGTAPAQSPGESVPSRMRTRSQLCSKTSRGNKPSNNPAARPTKPAPIVSALRLGCTPKQQQPQQARSLESTAGMETKLDKVQTSLNELHRKQTDMENKVAGLCSVIEDHTNDMSLEAQQTSNQFALLNEMMVRATRDLVAAQEVRHQQIIGLLHQMQGQQQQQQLVHQAQPAPNWQQSSAPVPVPDEPSMASNGTSSPETMTSLSITLPSRTTLLPTPSDRSVPTGYDLLLGSQSPSIRRVRARSVGSNEVPDDKRARRRLAPDEFLDSNLTILKRELSTLCQNAMASPSSSP
ncbi:hypothetical protein CAOG_03398 [Capsaspora owczarzaki ATCC 30864]|uniref:Uncharacterized protein n=1 Tax=Capsaspora owczarzaki (strain ATCC 30864) TaxID=595528 RepID=A0A0D2UBK9_CAPO3|nr:hypothetical protein CAOG_03398 [Capsaspora owczarzaki ATCC 30864]KJE92421.1 hypothetical protein CAOG_003398 [Capsaspora owczarzaki ATCC 30864]|eukprot:XP_004364237.1 hypothetical protein CAOG_03398 [Capsaspora owczarzaki ATCC 30864]